MQTSIAVTNFSWPRHTDIAGELAAVVDAAERGALDTVWVSDHLLQLEPGTETDEPMLEAYTTLGFLAARTQRVRLGTLVAAATMRPPALLVKAVTTLDVLSVGRAWLGVGAGYHEQEARALGFDLPPTAERFEWLEDTLRLAHQMWDADTARFEGRRVTAEEPVSSPRPATQPRPPIMVGGMGERRTLALVARYADACNLFDIPDEGATIRRKLAALADHCARVDRPFAEISKTVSTRLDPDDDAAGFAEHAQSLGALGIDHVIVLTRGPWTTDRVGVLSEAATLLRDSAG